MSIDTDQFLKISLFPLFILVMSFSGTLVNSIGFEWMLVGIACLGFIYAPLLTFLRAPPTREEKKVSGDVIPGNGMATNAVAAAIANGDATIEKKGIYNLSMTLDNGDLALPQPQLSPHIGDRTAATEQHVTKL